MASVRKRNQPHQYYYYSLPGDSSSSTSWEEKKGTATSPEQQQQQPLLMTSTSWSAAAGKNSSSSSSIGGGSDILTSRSSSRDKRFMSELTVPPPGAVPIQGIHGDENDEESPISIASSSSSCGGGGGTNVFFMSHNSHSLDEEDAQVMEEPLQAAAGQGGQLQLCGGPFATLYSNDDIFITTTNRVAVHTASSSTVRVVARFWNDAIQKSHAWILLLVVFILWPVGFYYHSTTSNSLATDNTLLTTFIPIPPTYSPSAKALDALSRNYYLNHDNDDSDDDGWRHDPSRPAMYVVLKATTPTSSSSASESLPFASLTRPDTEARHEARDFFDTLNHTIHQHCFHLNDMDDYSSSKSTSIKCLDPSTWLRATSFYSMMDQDEQLSWLARTTLATPGGKHVLYKLEYRYTGRSTSHKLVQVINDFIVQQQQQQQQQQEQYRYFTAHATGIPFLQQDLAAASANRNVTMVTWWTLPALSLSVICVMMLLKVILLPSNQRRAAQSSVLQDDFLVKPVLTTIVMTLATFWTTMSIESIVMHHVFGNNNHYWTPIIMSCLTVGMSIKYTMILLDGYLLQAIETHQSQEQQQLSAMIGHMLETSAPILVFSTVTMMTIFASLYFCGLPPLFQSVAIGASVAMLSTLIVSLTLVPALLYAQGSFWQQSSGWNLSKTIDQTRTTTTTFSVTTTTPLLLHHDYFDDDDLDSPRMENGTNDAATASSIFRQQPQGNEMFSPVPVSLQHSTKPIDSDNIIRRKDARHYWLSWHASRGGGAYIVGLLVVTLFVLAPVAWYAKDLNNTLSINLDLLLPRNSPSLETLRDLARQFNTVATTTSGIGRDDNNDDSIASSSAAGSPFLNPYQILFDGRAVGRKMASSEGFDIIQRVIDELMAIDRHPDDTAESDEEEDEEDHTTHIGMPMDEAKHLLEEMERVEKEEEWLRCADDRRLSSPTSKRPTTFYNGIAVLHNARIPYVMYSGGKVCMQMTRCPTKLMHVVATLDKLMTTRDEFGTIITATLGVDPFSNQGRVWLQEARATIQRMQQGGALEGVEVYIHGTAAMAHDTADAVKFAFPFMIRFMIIAVLLLMGLYFQSVFLPLQSLVTIGLTASFSFGLAALVNQKGFLNTASGNEVCWFVPAMALCLIVGFSLERGIFLSSRILQYHRLDGSNHKSSIAAGVNAAAGGFIMTSSGIAMALTFGSLLLFSATSPALKQLSFIISTAVLLDTLVIRPLVVPMLYDLVGPRLCWWPRDGFYTAHHHHHHHGAWHPTDG